MQISQINKRDNSLDIDNSLVFSTLILIKVIGTIKIIWNKRYLVIDERMNVFLTIYNYKHTYIDFSNTCIGANKQNNMSMNRILSIVCIYHQTF